jgi:hypothetical protein
LSDGGISDGATVVGVLAFAAALLPWET